MTFPISIDWAIDIGAELKQQDCVVVSPLKTVLCDGHGKYGDDFARAVCDFQIRNDGDPIRVFRETDQYLQSNFSATKYPYINGTSCTNLQMNPETNVVTIANIGDSAARYWDMKGSGISASVNHTPSNLQEFQRITDSGGICTFHDSSGKYSKGKQPTFVNGIYNASGAYSYKNCRKEHSVYFEIPENGSKNRSRCKLAMTRSFGDWLLVPYGLITEPAVHILPPPGEGVTRAIVMASDGLWDVMTDETIGNIVRQPEFLNTRDATASSNTLLEEALRKGQKLFGRNADNVSIVVAYV